MKRVAFAFDLDGTVTTAELLPLIAREADLMDEISVLTEATIKGVLPFRKSFQLRCRLLSDVPNTTVRRVVEGVSLQPHVEAFIREHRERCFIVTGNLDVWVEPLRSRLPCRFFTSTANVSGGRVSSIAHVLEKNQPIAELRKDFDTIVAVGDGMNDVPMFEVADVRIAYGGVHPPNDTLLKLADYAVYDGAALCRLLSTLL
jgi:HAD superfamily phosphoserine phosphatase-like hydrolase